MAIETLTTLVVGRVNLAVLAIVLKGNMIFCESIPQTHNGDSPNASGGPSRALASTYHCHANTDRKFHEPVQLILQYSTGIRLPESTSCRNAEINQTEADSGREPC